MRTNADLLQAKTLLKVLSAVTLILAAHSVTAEPPKVKGLYIGMDIKEASSVLKKRLPAEHYRIAEEQGGSSLIIKPEVAPELRSLAPALGTVDADPQGKVTKIHFTWRLVDILFDAGQMDASAFGRNFAKAYNIQRLQISDDGNYWIYTSPEGWEVRISTEKGVTWDQGLFMLNVKELKKAFD